MTKYSVLSSNSTPLSFIDSLQNRRGKALHYIINTTYENISKTKEKPYQKDNFINDFITEYVDPVNTNNEAYKNIIVEIPKGIRGNKSSASWFFTIKDVIGDGNCGLYSLAEQGFFDYSKIAQCYRDHLQKLFKNKTAITKYDSISQHRLAIKELIRLYYFGDEKNSINYDKGFRYVLRFHMEMDNSIFVNEKETDEIKGSRSDSESEQPAMTDEEQEQQFMKEMDREVRQKLELVAKNRTIVESSLLDALSYIFKTPISILGPYQLQNTMIGLIKAIVSKGNFGKFFEVTVPESEHDMANQLNDLLKGHDLFDETLGNDSIFDYKNVKYIAHVCDPYPFDKTLVRCKGIE